MKLLWYISDFPEIHYQNVVYVSVSWERNKNYHFKSFDFLILHKIVVLFWKKNHCLHMHAYCMLSVDFFIGKTSEIFQVLGRWTDEIRLAEQNSSKDVVKVLVGNKCDLPERPIELEEINKNMKDFYIKYFECSAKTRHNVDLMFKFIVDSCAEKMNRVSKHRITMRSQSTDHLGTTIEESRQFSWFCCCCK